MSELQPSVVRIRAEVSTDIDRNAARETILPGLEALTSSLEIPVTPELEIADGPGRIVIGHAAPLFGSGSPARTVLQAHDVWCYAEQFLTPELAQRIWRHWSPSRAADVSRPEFLELFHRMLTEAVRRGFRLGRFREVANTLPATATRADWDTCFEEVLSDAAPARVRLHLSREQYQQLIASTEGEDGNWEGLATFMHDGLFLELGVHFPGLSVHIDDSLIAPWFRCEWNDLHLPGRLGIGVHELLVNDTIDRLKLMEVEATAFENPATRQPSAIVPKALKESLESKGLTTWDARGYLILAVADVLRVSAGAFLSTPAIEWLLLGLEPYAPELVAATRARLPPQVLVRILRALVTEQVSIRDLQTILSSLIMVEGSVPVDVRRLAYLTQLGTTYVTGPLGPVRELAPEDYAEVARRSLKVAISEKLARSTGTLVVYLFDPEIERRLVASLRLSTQDREKLVAGVQEEAAHLPPTAQVPALLVSSGARARLQQELFPELRHFMVTSYDELTPQLNVQPVARITSVFG